VTAHAIEIEYTNPGIRYLLTVPAATFRPFEDGYDFVDHGRHLVHMHTPGNSTNPGIYLAPVNLPDGAVIHRMRYNFYINSTEAGVAKLQRTELSQGDVADLALAVTFPANAGIGSTFAPYVDSQPIDNSRYAYWLVWEQPSNALPGVNVQGQAVVIEYAMPIYLPFVLR